MNTELQTLNNFSNEQIEVIKNTVAKGITDIELQYFLILAKSLGLNPFNKEIWCYKDSKGNVLIFTGRDGFLVAAQKQPVYGGLRSAYVCTNDVFTIDIPNAKVQHTFSNKARGSVIGAYAIAFRKGCEPTVEWADFNTYNKGYNAWKTHPGAMIVKVAEANALKKAFGLAGVENEDTYDMKTESFGAPIDIEHEEEPIVQPEMTEEELPLEIEALITEADSLELLVSIFNDHAEMHTNKKFMEKLTARKAELRTQIAA